ncbi:heme-binding protein [bacterium]|nr:heme-binding protein [bacterium]
MKNLALHLSLAAALPLMAQPASKRWDSPAAPAATEPVYLSESALPKGWPAPGPYDRVTRKNYPAYRAAYTPGSSPNGGFWTLFQHIKRNGIPMTSPVEMTMKDESGSAMKMEQMGFLYQSPEVGKPGADGESVSVRDVPALSVLGYTWQGPRGDAEIAKARAAIDAVLAEKKLKATGYRLFGYNSPSVPRKKQTYELQALLK